MRRIEILKPKPLDEVNMVADVCTHEIQNRVYDTVRRELFSQIGSKRKFDSNMEDCMEHGLKRLKEHEWKAVQTDKDGGWCLVQIGAIKTMLRAKMDPMKYQKVEHVPWKLSKIC